MDDSAKKYPDKVFTIFVAFTNHALLNNYDLSSIMGCFSGGAPLAPEVCHQFEEKTGAVIFEGYGLTETAPVAGVNPTNRETRKIGSIGFPMPGTDIKIFSQNRGFPLLLFQKKLCIHTRTMILIYKLIPFNCN